MEQWEDLSRAERWNERPPGFSGSGEPPLSARVWTFLAVFPLAGATTSWLIVFATLMPAAPWFGMGPVLILFAGVFPFHFVATFISARNRRSWWSPFGAFCVFRYLPRRQLAIGVVSFAAAWLSMMVTAISGMPTRGQPTQVNGGYFQEIGDTMTPITSQRYNTELAGVERFFASGAAGLYAGSSLFFLSARAKALKGD